jgi:hypothetical protein
MGWTKKKVEAWSGGKPGTDYTLSAKKSPDGRKHLVKIRYSTYTMEYTVNIDGRLTEHRYKTEKEARKKATELRRLVSWQITQKMKGIKPFGGAVSVAIATNKPNPTVTALRKFGVLCKGRSKYDDLDIRLSNAGIKFRIQTVGQIGYHIPRDQLAFMRSRGVHSFQMKAKEFGIGMAWLADPAPRMLIFQTGPTGALHIADHNIGIPHEYAKKGQRKRKTIKIPRTGNRETADMRRFYPLRSYFIAHSSKNQIQMAADAFAGKRTSGVIRLYTVRKKTNAKKPKDSILFKSEKVEVNVPAESARAGKARLGAGHIPPLKAFLRMQHTKGVVMVGTRKGQAIFVLQPTFTMATKKKKGSRSQTNVYFLASR